ncbi:MAG: transposase family protein [Gammaproteobacteria bacterium]|jgi:predicted transposase YbfD/YdcC|nr:transposase family protein [Gammaproteobacteria bacterium]
MNIDGFLNYFDEVKDPRIDRSKKHLLSDILVISVLSFICGAETWNDIEDFGNANIDWLQEHLELNEGIPSHDTFARIFARINPKLFQECFVRLMRSWMDQTDGELIAIDGKTLRRSHDRKNGQGPLHLVSAWATKNRLSLGQMRTKNKSNEISAMKELLSLIDVKDCTVTIDAMGCQREIAKQIKASGGDYVLAVKGNQGNLYTGLIRLFEQAKELKYKAMVFSKKETVDGDHGRIETRNYTVLPLMYKFEYKKYWLGLECFIKVESKREVGERVSIESRYYISSLKADAEKLGEAIRGHWRIENSLHWCLDVVFHEDNSRIRTGHAPENIALLRRFALSLLGAEKTFKGGLRRKQRKALMDKTYLNLVLAGI